ncbi:unnamed protein product (macronuclear) [Paramecium tetraurelia]|uniref:Uncharacterized protein n=1 Tax=Paramecium tetraurelia TaxID=5888 RepID=A0C1U3_PARTE|nr:uncharacterized protein GSPATT00034237001 [Paramecium tetraurelia]CAK64760.1 unnamed protein product [Paramecium tetraurelia]|eukprot:XP_001432157.1 hypothetical protein (macronuclear) [Paramecium tetraurelia strain d4-2]
MCSNPRLFQSIENEQSWDVLDILNKKLLNADLYFQELKTNYAALSSIGRIEKCSLKIQIHSVELKIRSIFFNNFY